MYYAGKHKVLIIDDEADLCELIQYQFKKRGFEVMTAPDGLAGLECLKNMTPDVIILDINMPRMGGVEFYQKICGSDNRPRYPVLVLTARANLEQLFKEFAVQGFMTKPFAIDQLVLETESIINKSRRLTAQNSQDSSVGPCSIFVAEDDIDAFKKISVAFLEAEYQVDSARSGTVAIEKMMREPPDIALIKLGLKDIPGDIVAQRLHNFPKTANVKIILYTPKNEHIDPAILARFREKAEIQAVIAYANFEELLEAAERIAPS